MNRRHKLLDRLALCIAIVMLGIVFGLGILSTFTLVTNTTWVDHTHLVIEALDDLSTNLSQAINSRRGISLTGDEADVDAYAQSLRKLTDAKQRVRALTIDNLSQQKRLDALDPLVAATVARLDAAIEYRRTHAYEPEREADVTRKGTIIYHVLLQHIAELEAEERGLLVARERRTLTSVVRTEIAQAVGACLSLVIAAAVIVRLRREVERREHSEQAVLEREDAIKQLNQDLERRVEARTAQLAMADRELAAFSYAVIHDLRAPLRGMGGFAEVLLHDCEDTLTPDARECLHEIKHNAGRMATLIDALVSMSRVTRSELKRDSIDVTRLARDVAEQFAAADSRSLVIVIQENLGSSVDAGLVRTLLEILLDNARKFTGKMLTARIEVGVANMDGERVLFVRDNGAGFDMAHADKLFSPFGRLHTVEEFPGIGIGLAMAQRIVQRHGGRIWADGHVGEGAAFYFTLGQDAERTTS